ncbi:MAG: DNA polymerase [Thermoplasmataceae archaeon]
MTRPLKYLPDGKLNPKYKKDASRVKGSRVKKSPMDVLREQLSPKKRASGPSGHKTTKYERGEFVSWDGEGITLDDGRHIYVLLANSRGAYIVNPAGLTTVECLSFFVSQTAKYPNAIHTGFSFNYESTMVLADLPYDKAREIATDSANRDTYYNTYSIQYRARKELNIKKIGEPYHVPKMKKDGSVEYVRNIQGKALIWDVFGFFQSPFVDALVGWLGADYPDLDLIKAGKLHRGTFTAQQIEYEILPYCLAECRALEKLCEALLDALKEADIKISRWDGSGAISAALLKQYNVKAYMGAGEIPDVVDQAAQHAFFGGRIEIIQYGHGLPGTYYHNDINSAYPSIQADLPNLTGGVWTHDTRNHMTDKTFSLCLVEWKLSATGDYYPPIPIYPFPYRESGDTVIFPTEGKGWYWYPEVNAALNHLPSYQEQYPDAYIKILETWSMSPADDYKPFSWMREKYKLRQQWKAEGRAGEKVLKLGYNGGYGKTVQHLGYNPETGRKPPFHNILWGGYITSGTRAKLYAAAMQAPQDILFLATDGIISTVPLVLPQSMDLGEWETETHDEIVIVQSGVYGYRNGGKWKIFSRGFDKGSLTLESILDAWKKKETQTYFPCTRFVSLRAGTVSENAYHTRCRRWVSVQHTDKQGNVLGDGRKLKLVQQGTKRRERVLPDGRPVWAKGKKFYRPDQGLIPTWPSRNLAGFTLSKKYALPWDSKFEPEYLDGIDARIVEEEIEDEKI